MTKVLITGSEGFIGKHLWTELESVGYEVIGIDKTFVEYEDVYFQDLTEKGSFAECLHNEQPHVVIHLAAQVGRLFGEDDLEHTIRSNAIMTTFVANACGQAGVKLMYASTSEVYGDQGTDSCFEFGKLRLPHNLYGLSKRWGEETCQLYAPDGLVTMRFSMPYGAGVVPGRGRAALPNMLWQAHNGLEIPVHKGSERSWCWIGDTVRAVRLILDNDAEGPFNIGRDDDYRPMEWIASEACDMVGADKSLINLIDAPQNQTVVKRLSTMRIRTLGWKPEVEIEEGMNIVKEWVTKFDANGNKVR